MVGDPAPRGHTSYDEFVAGVPGRAPGRRGRGLSHALLLGHDRPPQGRAPPAERAALRHRRDPGPACSAASWASGAGDVYLSPAPLYHSAPLVWSMTAQRMGGTVVLMEHFDPERCLALMQEHRVTHAQFVPTMFVRMLKLPDDVRASLRRLLAALGGARGGAVRARGQAPDDRVVGPVIHEYYSGTEGMGMTWISSEESLTHAGLGRRAIWGEVHVCGDDGEELPTGEDGVVYFGGRSDAHLRVQPRPREDAPDVQRQGLGHAVGRRAPRRRGLPVPDRPQAVHDRVGRREHLPPGDRGRPRAAPRRGRRRRLRHPRARDGRGGQGGRPARPGLPGRARARGRDHRLLPRPTSRTTSARARSTSPMPCPGARTASSTRRSCASPTGPARPPAPPEPRGAARRRTRPGGAPRRRRRAARW